ncbi:hypothetical protein AB0D91_09815 [Streptomyces canus]|uniref:hypothetical protein n=1 Tax=Streptomyces canus TaxID=58343 RepID=UPI00340C0E78
MHSDDLGLTRFTVDLESQLLLERDMSAAEEFLASVGGKFVQREQDLPGVLWVELQPRNRERAPFTVRMIWTVYPHRPPSVHFADEPGGVTTVTSAWPAADGYRAPSNDICKPFTAEGQQLHADWASGPYAWSGTGNPLLYVLETIQGDIDRADGRRAA